MEFQLFRVQGLAGLALINLSFTLFFGNGRVDSDISISDGFMKGGIDVIF
jgi:hypothetical protein